MVFNCSASQARFCQKLDLGNMSAFWKLHAYTCLTSKFLSVQVWSDAQDRCPYWADQKEIHKCHPISLEHFLKMQFCIIYHSPGDSYILISRLCNSCREDRRYLYGTYKNISERTFCSKVLNSGDWEVHIWFSYFYIRSGY